ncbi:MAG: DegV family EDD domain-containing protein [Candidatus Beckwithbacteria bacterium]|nr:DegV family EDD domain-containing protein [Candidatus Beckwithbacteria bacterium]
MSVEIVSDTGCGYNATDPEITELGIHLLPIHTKFFIDGQTVVKADGELTPEEFLALMAKSTKQLPETDGSVLGPALELYPRLADSTQQILSIHISSVLSAVYGSASVAAGEVMEKKPGLTIGLIDSKRVSLTQFLLVELAAKLAKAGASLAEIQEAVILAIPKTGLIVGLEKIDNLVRLGRAPKGLDKIAKWADAHILLGMSGESGELKRMGFVRGLSNIPQRLTDEVASACEKPGIAGLAIIHTGVPNMAGDLAGFLQEIYSGKILIKDITGTGVSIHSAQGAVGVAFMTN